MTGMEKLAGLVGGTVVSKSCIWVEGVPFTEEALGGEKESNLPFNPTRILRREEIASGAREIFKVYE